MLQIIYSWTFLCFFGALVFWLASKLAPSAVPVTLGKKQARYIEQQSETSEAIHLSPFWLLPSVAIALVLVWYLATQTDNGYWYLNSGLNIVCCTLFFVRLCAYFELPHDSVWVLWSCLTLGVLAGLSGMMLPSWLIFNGVALMVATVLLTSWNINHLRYLFILLTGIIVYDVWGVLVSGMITELVLSTINHSEPWLPAGMLIVVPANFWDFTSPVLLNRLGILGMGDIMLSGIAVIAALRYRLADWVFVGFTVGLFVTSIVSHTYRVPLPAMLFLSPCLMFFFVAGARWRNVQLTW